MTARTMRGQRRAERRLLRSVKNVSGEVAQMLEDLARFRSRLAVLRADLVDLAEQVEALGYNDHAIPAESPGPGGDGP